MRLTCSHPEWRRKRIFLIEFSLVRDRSLHTCNYDGLLFGCDAGSFDEKTHWRWQMHSYIANRGRANHKFSIWFDHMERRRKKRSPYSSPCAMNTKCNQMANRNDNSPAWIECKSWCDYLIHRLTSHRLITFDRCTFDFVAAYLSRGKNIRIYEWIWHTPCHAKWYIASDEFDQMVKSIRKLFKWRTKRALQKFQLSHRIDNQKKKQKEKKRATGASSSNCSNPLKSSRTEFVKYFILFLLLFVSVASILRQSASILPASLDLFSREKKMEKV